MFAYVTTAQADLAAETADVASSLTRLLAAAQRHGLDGIEGDARALVSRARRLEETARTADDRQRSLTPADAELARTRRDALETFGRTTDYAGAVADLVEGSADLDLQDLVRIAQRTAALAGIADELSTAYLELDRELASWAEAHPADAATAIARYG